MNDCLSTRLHKTELFCTMFRQEFLTTSDVLTLDQLAALNQVAEPSRNSNARSVKLSAARKRRGSHRRLGSKDALLPLEQLATLSKLVPPSAPHAPKPSSFNAAMAPHRRPSITNTGPASRLEDNTDEQLIEAWLNELISQV